MSIANYSTSVEAIKTIGEIEGILVGHGAKSILTNYDDQGIVESLSFIVKTAYGDLPIRLPINANIEQIFLPYMITKNEQTLYEAMVDKKFYLKEGEKP